MSPWREDQMSPYLMCKTRYIDAYEDEELCMMLAREGGNALNKAQCWQNHNSTPTNIIDHQPVFCECYKSRYLGIFASQCLLPFHCPTNAKKSLHVQLQAPALCKNNSLRHGSLYSWSSLSTSLTASSKEVTLASNTLTPSTSERMFLQSASLWPRGSSLSRSIRLVDNQ